MSIRFRFDWIDDAQPSPDRLSCHTMAALSIEAGGATVTSVLDRSSRSWRDHVVVPLVHVAEWLAGNWWHLFYEVEHTGEQKPGFECRHDLAFAGDGFVLPSLTMVPAHERIRLRWRRYKPEHARIEFVDEGAASVEREALEAQLRDLVEAVLARLRDRGLTLETLDREWAAVNALDPDEREFSRAAARLGVDPFDVPDALADAIVRFGEHADPAVRDDALAAASADSLPHVGRWLSQAFEDLEETATGSGWEEVRRALPRLSAMEPWRRGYDLARSVRRQLGVGGDGRFDFDRNGSPALRFHERPSPATCIQGLVAADAPACVVAPRSESGKRFLLARALGDYLGRREPGPAILSSLATDRQAQSRAFAAELLAPAKSLRRRLGSPLAEPEQVDELGHEYGVSTEVVRRQIENHGLATVVGW